MRWKLWKKALCQKILFSISFCHNKEKLYLCVKKTSHLFLSSHQVSIIIGIYSNNLKDIGTTRPRIFGAAFHKKKKKGSCSSPLSKGRSDLKKKWKSICFGQSYDASGDNKKRSFKVDFFKRKTFALA